MTLSNGIGWSPDGTAMYYIDSIRGCVDVFDIDKEGALGHRRELIGLSGEPGAGPDGLTVDADGGIWIAWWGASRVVRVNPRGTIEYTVHVPTPYVTSVAFGGPRLDQLFITTARLDDARGQQEGDGHAGDLFVAAAPAGVTGLQTKRVTRSQCDSQGSLVWPSYISKESARA